jgi:hypothetical protein
MADEQLALSDAGVTDYGEGAMGTTGKLIEHATNRLRLPNIRGVGLPGSPGLADLIQCRVGCRFVLIVVDAHIPSDLSKAVTDRPPDPS